MSTAAAERQAREHGSRIITALERAWAAIQARHPEVPDVVIVTGAGSHQKGTPEGYRLRGHHWPERWVTDPAERRMPELFMAGELLPSSWTTPSAPVAARTARAGERAARTARVRTSRRSAAASAAPSSAPASRPASCT